MLFCRPHSRFASPPRSLLATVDTPAHLAETRTNTCENKLDFCGLFAETPRHLCWMSFGPHRDSLFVSSSPSNKKIQDSCLGICLKGLQTSERTWVGPEIHPAKVSWIFSEESAENMRVLVSRPPRHPLVVRPRAVLIVVRPHLWELLGECSLRGHASSFTTVVYARV